MIDLIRANLAPLMFGGLILFMTLYIWDKDAKGVSNCYDKCATAWPPLLVDASTKVDGDWTLVDRKDSDKKVVAYKGWPLYLWIKDTKPGDTTGDGVGGTWHTAVEGMRVCWSRTPPRSKPSLAPPR